MKKLFTLLLLSTFIIGGCTIQRRQHLPGYSIHWNKSYQKNAGNELVENKEKGQNPQGDLNIGSIETSANENLDKRSNSFENTERTSVSKNAFYRTEESNKEGVSVRSSATNSSDLSVAELKTNTEREVVYNMPDKEKDATALLALSSLAIALSSFGLYRAGRKRMKNYTRWAKYNPKKAQWLIAGLQIPLMSLGLYSGYNLHQMGYSVSSELLYGFGAVTAIGFATVPFFPKREQFTLPGTLNRRRIAFLSIAVSGLMMTTVTGNRLEKDHSDSTLTSVLRSIDASTFSNATYSHEQADSKYDTESSLRDKVQKKQLLKKRLLLAGGSCALGIFLIILLIVPLCAGICMIIFGIAGLPQGAFLALLGVLLSFLSVLGMTRAAKMCQNR